MEMLRYLLGAPEYPPKKSRRYMSHSLNSSEGGYVGDYVGEYYRVY